MSTPDSKPPSLIPPVVPAARTQEMYRAKSIATRLTDAEFAEVEAASDRAGKKVAEWLRDAALARARTVREEETDRTLLAELMALRTLMLNLFAAASKGPLSEESLRKISAYAESLKSKRQRNSWPRGGT